VREYRMKEGNLAKTTVELPEPLHKTLRVKAALENRSMNEIIVSALRDYLGSFRLEPGMLEVETVSRDRTASAVKEG
jgi:plasmid stability protein